MRVRSLFRFFVHLLVLSSLAFHTSAVVAQDLGDEAEAAAPDPGDFANFMGNTQGPTEEELAARQEKIDQLNAEAKAKADAGDINGAFTAYDQAARDPETVNFTSLVEAARLLMQMEETADAIKYYGNAMQMASRLEDPSDALPALLELGDAYLETEQYNSALDYLNLALGQPGQSRNPEILFKLGKAQSEFALNQQYSTAQTRREQLQQALSFYDKALRINPNYAEALYERGTAHDLIGDRDKAIEDLNSAFGLDSTNTDALAQLGLAALNRGLGESVQRQGQTAKILRDLNLANQALSRYLSMTPEDQDLDEDDPTAIRRENVLVNRSAAYLGLGDEGQGSSYYQQAITDAEAAIEIDPDKDDAFFQKGLAHGRLGNLQEADAAFSEAIELAPNAEYLLRRGIIRFRMGDFEVAKSDLNLSIRASRGQNPRGYFWLGLCRHKQDDLPNAVKEYTQAIRYASNYEFAYMNRGLVYMKMGRYERATEDFNTVMRLNRDN